MRLVSSESGNKMKTQPGPLRPAGGDPGLDHHIFLTVFVSLSGLGPSETYEKRSMTKLCYSSNEKQAEKLFLPRRRSALPVRPLSWLAKNRRQGKPCQNARDWSIRYGALCRSKLLSPALRVSLVPLRIVEKATENEIYASGEFCLLSFSLSLCLSLSLSLSLCVSTLKNKKSCPLGTVDPSKSSQSLSSKFILSTLDFAFDIWRSNCALHEDSAGVTVVGSRTKLRVPALTGPLQQTSLNVATKFRSPQLTQLAVADSNKLERKKKSSDLFPGILQCGAAFWPTTCTWLPCWTVSTFVELESESQ